MVQLATNHLCAPPPPLKRGRPVPDVAKLVAETTEFKTNCNLVIIDFLIRWERGACLQPALRGRGFSAWEVAAGPLTHRVQDQLQSCHHRFPNQVGEGGMLAASIEGGGGQCLGGGSWTTHSQSSRPTANHLVIMTTPSPPPPT